MGSSQSALARKGQENDDSDNPLCQACRRLDLPRIFAGARIESELSVQQLESGLGRYLLPVGAPSGWMATNCRLCHLFRYVHGSDHGDCLGNDEICYLLPLRADLTLSRNGDGQLQIDNFQSVLEHTELATDVYIVFLKVSTEITAGGETPYSWTVPKSLLHSWHRFKLDARCAAPGRPGLNHAPWSDGAVNWSALRSYLKSCEKIHQGCTEEVDMRDGGWRLHQDKRQQKAHAIRCIDVITRRRTSRKLSDRYVALSYVWGGYLAATGSQWPSLFLPGMKLRMEALPRTIQDAIMAVRLLGERYLWVDLICIDQDDPKDFDRQISQMHLIYESAIFTIVALHGDSAQAGIPGIGSVRRKHPEAHIKIDGKLIIVGPHIDFLGEVTGSKWRSRGWTFQEEQSSRRCIYFGSDEVFIRCGMSHGRETLDWHEDSESEAPFLEDKRVDEEARLLFRSGLRDWNLEHYQNAVANYTSRLLTYPTDILNAFLGTLQRMEYMYNMNFVCALPQDDLLSGLLWAPKSNIEPLSRRALFPSWTWLEWAGNPVYYPFNTIKWATGERHGRWFDNAIYPSPSIPTYIGEAFEARCAAQVAIDSLGTSPRQLRITSEIRSFKIVRQVKTHSSIKTDINLGHTIQGQT